MEVDGKIDKYHNLYFTIYQKERGKGSRKIFIFLFRSLFSEKDMWMHKYERAIWQSFNKENKYIKQAKNSNTSKSAHNRRTYSSMSPNF